jgi:inner membrane protein
MNARTHLLIAMLFGWVYLNFIQVLAFQEKFIFALFLVGSALLPDIDDPQSTLGRKHKIISSLTSHRGILHSIWIPVIAFIVARYIPLIQAPLLGLAIGYGSHLASDALTIKGIAPLAPLMKFRIKWFVRTGSFVETIIAALIVMFFIVQPLAI